MRLIPTPPQKSSTFQYVFVMSDDRTAPSSLTERQTRAFPITIDSPDTSRAVAIMVLGWIIFGIGLLPFCVGIHFMVAGPDVVTYSRFTGPTLTQILKMFPGPTTSIGLFVTSVGFAVWRTGKNSKTTQYNRAVEDGLRRNDIATSDLGDQYKLGLRRLTGRRFAIELIEQAA